MDIDALLSVCALISIVSLRVLFSEVNCECKYVSDTSLTGSLAQPLADETLIWLTAGYIQLILSLLHTSTHPERWSKGVKEICVRRLKAIFKYHMTLLTFLLAFDAFALCPLQWNECYDTAPCSCWAVFTLRDARMYYYIFVMDFVALLLLAKAAHRLTFSSSILILLHVICCFSRLYIQHSPTTSTQHKKCCFAFLHWDFINFAPAYIQENTKTIKNK